MRRPVSARFHAVRFKTVGSALLCLALAACQRDVSVRKDADPELRARALALYADVAFAAYGDAVRTARVLERTVAAFVGAPDEDKLGAARHAWLAAREPYLQTEVYRFYDGPIDRLESRINPWPIDESYIESLTLDPKLGIINDEKSYPTLTRALLVELNEKEGEKNIATGYHAIEFLLWGRDTNSNGPGQRPASDFVDDPEHGGNSPKRRREYLELVVALLVSDLEEVARAWDPKRPDGYRAQFLAKPDESVAHMIKGIGTLVGPELSGERLTVPYETKDQENEHSCFSDNTHIDVVFDAVGALNLCVGKYRRLDGSVLSGPGICELVATVDPAVGQQLRQQLQNSESAARHIPGPFDQAILGGDERAGRVAVKRTIDALRASAATLGNAANLLGARVSVAVVP